MARKLYSVKYEKVTEFIKNNKSEIKSLLVSNHFEYAKLFGNTYYELRIKEFIEQYKIDSGTLFEQLLIEKGKAFYSECCKKEGKPLRMALVVSPTKAIYFTEEMEASLSDTIPSGGVLLDTMGEIIASHTIHYLKD